MQVQYAGWEDVRELAAVDLKKVGVEGFKSTHFHRQVPTEVSDEVGQALLENPDMFGDFVETETDMVDDSLVGRGSNADEGVEVNLDDPTGEPDEGAANVTAASGDAATTTTGGGRRSGRGAGGGSTRTSRT